MKLAYAIKDRATDSFGIPLFFQTAGQANRAFSDAINNTAKDNDLAKHPDDYDMYFVGYYDEERGRFNENTTHQEPELLARGKDLLIRKDN